MKKLLLLIPLLLLCGCASGGTPLDLIWPTVVPPTTEHYLEHKVPSLWGITTLSVLRLTQEEIELKFMLNQMEYQAASKSTAFIIKATESMQNDILAALAAVGLGTAGIGIPIASRRKRKEDWTPEEVAAETQRVGSMEPVDFKEEQDMVASKASVEASNKTRRKAKKVV